MSSGSEMGRGTAAPKRKYGLTTSTGRLKAAAGAKKAASMASKRAQVAARKAKQAVTGKSGANASKGGGVKGGKPADGSARKAYKSLGKARSRKPQ